MSDSDGRQEPTLKTSPGSKVGTWDTLRLHPTTLMRMVVEGKATVIGEDKHGRKIYEIKEEEPEGYRAAV